MARLSQARRSPSILLGPALIIFLSANIANAANLAFNMLFARLMDPGQFADLTLLLSIKLGLLSIFSAVQFSLADHAARQPADTARQMASWLSKRSFVLSLSLAFLVIISAETIARALNFDSISALITLFLALPLFLPMVIYRGLAQGRMDLPKMVGSFQLEWIVRLFGCWALWQLGFGLTGIAVALVASILAGFLFTVDREDLRTLVTARKEKVAKPAQEILHTTWPYALIVVAQVLLLDGDIFIAKAMFIEAAAGDAAGLLLIQRIFFFAFLCLATVLQPFVAKGGHTPREAARATLTLLGAMTAVSAIGLSLIALLPDLFVTILLGDQFAGLAIYAVAAGAVGGCLVAVQIVVVAKLAQGQRKAPLVLLAIAALYYAALIIALQSSTDMGPQTLIELKLIIGGAAAAMTGAILTHQAFRST